MVLILDGNSEISTHALSDLGYLICLWHLFRSRALTNQNFYVHTYVTCSELPSNLNTMLEIVLFYVIIKADRAFSFRLTFNMPFIFFTAIFQKIFGVPF